MAHAVLMDPRFTFNSVDLADHVTDLELTVNTDTVEEVAGQDTVVTVLAALRRFGGTVSGLQDYAAGEVDATLYAAWLARTAYAVTMGPDRTSAISTSNPEYQFSGFVGSYNPVAGSIGQVMKFSLTILPSTDLTRDVTP